jgi:hypothetical protein
MRTTAVSLVVGFYVGLGIYCAQRGVAAAFLPKFDTLPWRFVIGGAILYLFVTIAWPFIVAAYWVRYWYARRPDRR